MYLSKVNLDVQFTFYYHFSMVSFLLYALESVVNGVSAVVLHLCCIKM